MGDARIKMMINIGMTLTFYLWGIGKDLFPALMMSQGQGCFCRWFSINANDDITGSRYFLPVVQHQHP